MIMSNEWSSIICSSKTDVGGGLKREEEGYDGGNIQRGDRASPKDGKLVPPSIPLPTFQIKEPI